MDTSQARIVLLDSNQRVLQDLPGAAVGAGGGDLRLLGIDVRLGVRAVGIDPEGLDVLVAGEPGGSRPRR